MKLLSGTEMIITGIGTPAGGVAAEAWTGIAGGIGIVVIGVGVGVVAGVPVLIMPEVVEDGMMMNAGVEVDQ